MNYNFQVIQKDAENRILTCSTSLTESELHKQMEDNFGLLCGGHGKLCEAGTIFTKEMARAYSIPLGGTFVKFKFDENEWQNVAKLGIGDKMADSLCKRNKIEKGQPTYGSRFGGKPGSFERRKPALGNIVLLEEVEGVSVKTKLKSKPNLTEYHSPESNKNSQTVVTGDNHIPIEYSEAKRLEQELVSDVNDPKILSELLKSPEGKAYYASIERRRLAERAKNRNVVNLE